MIVKRSWHWLPASAGAALLAYIHWKHRAEFFSTNKAAFETVAAIAGLVGTVATFIEVIRAAGISAVLSANMGAVAQRKRVTEISRLVQELRSAMDLLDNSKRVSSRTASDISGLLRSLYPTSATIGGKSFTHYEAKLSRLSEASSKSKTSGDVERQEVSVALAEIRNHVDAERGEIQRKLDALVVGAN